DPPARHAQPALRPPDVLAGRARRDAPRRPGRAGRRRDHRRQHRGPARGGAPPTAPVTRAHGRTATPVSEDSEEKELGGPMTELTISPEEIRSAISSYVSSLETETSR